MRRLPLVVIWCACAAALAAQSSGLDQATLSKALSDSWPTYSGDYSGRRFSSLSQINQQNVRHMTLAWTSRLPVGTTAGGGVPFIEGGEIAQAVPVGGAPRVMGSVLMVNGILYASAPDHAWAVDARDGTVLWHYYWRTRGGTHIGNRGMGMYGNWLYFVTPDDFLISLDARTGKERWHKEIADFDQQYFLTMAPIVIGNHILVGTSNDLDAPGILQSFEPESGELQWQFYSVPMKAGDPGLETWKSLDAASHGGAQAWVPGVYDPETRLYIYTTGNPTPAYTTAGRGDGDNLFTCTLIAVNVDTGKMAWYYQTSPADTHDWDSAQTPVLVDGVFGGRQRKMAMTAARNGYFFVVDRVTGEHLLTSKYSVSANWAKPALNAKGQPVRDPLKDPIIPGALVAPTNSGASNWYPPAFSPDTGLFYVASNDAWAMYYLSEADTRAITGLGGKQEVAMGELGSSIYAIDYKTGRVAWRHQWPTPAGGGAAGRFGILTTAGRLLFTGDPAGNAVALDVTTGRPLWHSRIGVSNAPQTYLIDGRQYVLVAGGDTLYAFTLEP